MNLKVLSVDDSSTILKHLDYMLTNIEHIDWIGHAYELSKAKKMIIKHHPDVVLLDIMVNDENGFDLLHFIKCNYPKMAVLMLSNVSDAIYIKKSMQMGACRYIDKSFEFYLIEDILNTIYETKKAG